MIDNYDSFVHNLARYFERLGQATLIVRNDASTSPPCAMRPAAVVLSPGPCTPHEAGASLDIVRAFHTEMPMLGVCLGHQVIAEALGGRIVRAAVPVHGRTSQIRHDGTGIFSRAALAARPSAAIIRWSSTQPRCRPSFDPRPGPRTTC